MSACLGVWRRVRSVTNVKNRIDTHDTNQGTLEAWKAYKIKVPYCPEKPMRHQVRVASSRRFPGCATSTGRVRQRERRECPTNQVEEHRSDGVASPILVAARLVARLVAVSSSDEVAAPILVAARLVAGAAAATAVSAAPVPVPVAFAAPAVVPCWPIHPPLHVAPAHAT